MTAKDTIVKTVRLPVETAKILEEMQKDLDRTGSEIIRRALNSYIKVYQQRKEKEKNGKNK